MKPLAIITGATSGIGRALALHLSGDCDLLLNGRREAELRRIAEECSKAAANVHQVRGSVADRSIVEEIARIAAGADQELWLVNNAGIAEFGELETMALEAIEEQIAINFTAAIALTHALLPSMLERGSGQILNVLSIAATHVFSTSAVYSATKAGMLQFSRCLSAQVRTQGVRVMSVLPGSTDTALWEGKSFQPPAGDMLSAAGVAEKLRDILLLSRDRSIDELTIMPPKGIL